MLTPCVTRCTKTTGAAIRSTAPKQGMQQGSENDTATQTPSIKFMGLLDTVGALGVPSVDAGIGLSYEFYDQVVSSEVQHVYQALATHDRLSVFTPCFVRRNAELDGYTTREAWFPGAHYDVGHQRFVFPRDAGIVERTLSHINDHSNIMGLNVRPTKEYSMLVLRWMMDRMLQHNADIIHDAAIDWYFNVPWHLAYTGTEYRRIR